MRAKPELHAQVLHLWNFPGQHPGDTQRDLWISSKHLNEPLARYGSNFSGFGRNSSETIGPTAQFTDN